MTTTSTALARRRSSLPIALVPTTSVTYLEGKKQLPRLQQMTAQYLKRIEDKMPQINALVQIDLRSHYELKKMRVSVLPAQSTQVDVSKLEFTPFSEQELKQHWFCRREDKYDANEPSFLNDRRNPAYVTFLQRVRQRTGFWQRIRSTISIYPGYAVMKQLSPLFGAHNGELHALTKEKRGGAKVAQEDDLSFALLAMREIEKRGCRHWKFKKPEKQQLIDQRHIATARIAMIKADERGRMLVGYDIDRREGDNTRPDPVAAARAQEEELANAYQRSMRNLT